MCFARTNTIISLCRQIVDAEHELCRLLRTHHVREDMEQVRADVAARGGAEALRVMERALSEVKARERRVRFCESCGMSPGWDCEQDHPDRISWLAEAGAREGVER